VSNRFYKLFTKKEIPNEDERRAVNCYYASLSPCDNRTFRKCRLEFFGLWKRCPKQTGKKYRGEDNESNSQSKEHDREGENG
jgi:hypothetical protein